MKYHLPLIGMLFLGILTVSNAQNDFPPEGYLDGAYVIVGRLPDSKQTYQGTIKVSTSNQVLNVARVINGQKTVALGKFETTQENARVLKLNLDSKGKKYEESCLVSNDLDNYARVTCYVYGKTTKKVGLETWFNDHGQFEQK
jgi:hypothetical protein